MGVRIVRAKFLILTFICLSSALGQPFIAVNYPDLAYGKLLDFNNVMDMEHSYKVSVGTTKMIRSILGYQAVIAYDSKEYEFSNTTIWMDGRGRGIINEQFVSLETVFVLEVENKVRLLAGPTFNIARFEESYTYDPLRIEVYYPFGPGVKAGMHIMPYPGSKYRPVLGFDWYYVGLSGTTEYGLFKSGMIDYSYQVKAMIGIEFPSFKF